MKICKKGKKYLIFYETKQGNKMYELYFQLLTHLSNYPRQFPNQSLDTNVQLNNQDDIFS